LNNKLAIMTRTTSTADRSTIFHLFLSWILIAATVVSPVFSAAQSVTVTGKVTDEAQQPLAGATVSVKGKPSTGVTTDARGIFSIKAGPGELLLVEFVGFQPQEIKAGTKELNVRLATLPASLNDVVVIGYGTVRRKDLTGAVASIKGSDIKSQGVSDMTRSLQGKLPGVTIESAGGDPGSGTRILIRGVGTLGNAAPLYIVDGVQVANINNISSSDIASLDVLKDASAAAIYGSRAANGVVLVTTRSGRSGIPVIQFNTNVGAQRLARKMPVLNARQWANVSNAAHDAAGLARLDIAKNPDSLGTGTDWQDAIFRTGIMQQYDLSVSGGSENGRYSVSGGYNDQQGIVDVTGYKRYNLRVKSDTKKGAFQFGETILLTREKWIRTPTGWGGQGGGPVGSATKMIPVFSIYDTSAPGGYAGAYGPVVNVANPVAQLHLEDINYELTNILANAYGEITILPGLKYKLNLGYTNTFGSNYDYYHRYQVGTLFSHPTNDISMAKDQTNLVLLENTLSFDRHFGKHSLQALAGYTYQQTKYSYTSASKTDLPDGIDVLDAGAGTASTGGNRTQSDLVSVLGRAIYSYDNRYLLTASFRRDGSSRFGSANRYGNFPSVAVGWNIANEQFYHRGSLVPTLKLRASYGVLGNQEIGDYQYSAAISSNINYVTGVDQHKWFGAIQTAFASPNIKWETTKTSDIGVDAGLLDNHLNLTLDYFIKQTSDVLLNVPIPGSAGSSTNPVVNAGTLRNNGFELGLNYGNHAGALEYNFFGTLSVIRNKVIQLGTGTQQIFGGQPTHHGASTTVTQAGGPVSAFYLVKADGIFNTQDEVNNYSKNGTLVQPNAAPGDIKFFDANGDGQISDADRVYCGSPFPKFEYGFGASGNWRNLDINLFFQGTSGNKIYNGLRQDLESMSLEFNYSTATLNAWTPQRHTSIPRAVINDPNFNDRTSSRFLESGSYFRMKTLQIGYTFPAPRLRSMHLTSVRAYLSADNLFTVTKYSGFNPDIGRSINNPTSTNVSQSSGILNRGVDFGHVAYPIARTFSAGVQISL